MTDILSRQGETEKQIQKEYLNPSHPIMLDGLFLCFKCVVLQKCKLGDIY